tara:strand:+ start:6853 stop:7050 length:198 start_codon:yes stop_codon:yes gene_type:complete
MLKRIEVELHCRVWGSFMYIYLISTLGGVNRREIGSLFSVVESPNALRNSTAIVRELSMIATPNR